MNIIIWDTETNGLTRHHSVLSISAIKCSLTIEGNKVKSEIIDRYERFYFRKPGEAIEVEAINVNGLTDDVITLKRGKADYPDNFRDDINSFRQFCSDTRHFIGHNIFYDTQYINFCLQNTFCTMITNTRIIGLKRISGQPKFPSLKETAKFYNVEIKKSKLHSSMYDSYITYHIFLKMLEFNKTKDKAFEFLEKK